MACKNIAKLCKRLVISNSVTYSAGTLVINLPAGSYADGEKYCIIVAQPIPNNTTINALVAITIGEGTTRFPLVNRCCAQLTAAAIRTRTKYSAQVVTNTTGGTFKLLGNLCCVPDNRLTALDADT